jgi:saccharopine dehydrogenase (NAD+, L-lysine-forming)
MKPQHLWLRAERGEEKRVPLFPEDAAKLIQNGHFVTVEESPHRCAKDEEYMKVGCTIVAAGSWIRAPPSAIIVGLRALPQGDFPLIHRHVYLAHAFKGQLGWQDLLNRFVRGDGLLYDVEYLTDENGRRMVAFSRPAGSIAFVLAVLVWSHQQQNLPIPAIPVLENMKQLLDITKVFIVHFLTVRNHLTNCMQKEKFLLSSLLVHKDEQDQVLARLLQN